MLKKLEEKTQVEPSQTVMHGKKSKLLLLKYNIEYKTSKHYVWEYQLLEMMSKTETLQVSNLYACKMTRGKMFFEERVMDTFNIICGPLEQLRLLHMMTFCNMPF